MQEEKEIANEEVKAAKRSEEVKTEQDAVKAERKDAKEAEKEDKKSTEFGERKEIEGLEEGIMKLKKEVTANEDAYFKAYVNTENPKKRLQSESDNVHKHHIWNFAMGILPALGSPERALDVKVNDQSIKNYTKGLEMICQQLIHILNQKGVRGVEALDKPLDSNFHQAPIRETKDGMESGMVIEVLQKGYMLRDRVLRTTLVKVSEQIKGG